MKLKLDPSTYTQQLVPEDDYEAVIIKLYKTTSAAGNRSGGFQMELKSDAAEAKTVGRKIIGNVTVTEDSLWKANQLHKAVTGEDMPAEEFADEDAFLDWLFEQVNGQGLRIRVKHKPDNRSGELRADISYLKPS